MSPLTLIYLVAAAVVLIRALCLAPKSSAIRWQGHPLRFFGLALSYALLVPGAFGCALARPYGPTLLLIAVAMLLTFDRRRKHDDAI